MHRPIAVVTGGSSGLGLAIARRHLQEGDAVCILGRNQRRLEHAVRELTEVTQPDALMAVSCNVANEDEVAGAFASVSHGGFVPHVVYNVAGIGLYGDVRSVGRDMLDRLLEANLIGLIVVSTHAIRAMEATGGVLVNVMSSAARRPGANEAAYCAAKWGARGYTESIAVGLRGSGVRVVAVYPSGMNTPFWSGDTGQVVDASAFMDPVEVADVIVSVVRERGTLHVSELVIEKK